MFLNENAGSLSLMSSRSKPPGVALHARNGQPNAVLSLTGEGGTLGLWNNRSKDAAISLFANDGPTIRLDDEQGYSATLGRVDLASPKRGETHKTSAASVVFVGKDKTVIWKAP